MPKEKFIHVEIMDEFWNQDRIPAYVEILKHHHISYNINQIGYETQTRSYPIMKGKQNLDI